MRNLSRWFVLIGLLWRCAAGTPVQFRTIFGDIEVELYDREKPVTVSNFLSYVRLGRYQNTFFHRGVPGFVFQGGGFTVQGLHTSHPLIYDIETGPSIPNEFHVGPFISNGSGTISMAKTSDPNSANSQFFFNLVDNAGSLDNITNSGGFTVFGHTVSGTNILALLNGFVSDFSNPTNLIVNLNPALGLDYSRGPFGEVPLLQLNTNYTVINTNFPAMGTNLSPQIFFKVTNFIFVDISVLNVKVRDLGIGGREISWRSASGTTNWVEYTTQQPPLWQVLTHLPNPPAGTNVVVDPSAERSRFYRVRANY